MANNLLFELFEIKQKFLREIPHPKLIAKQIKLIDKQLVDQPEGQYDIKAFRLGTEAQNQSLIAFLEDHIQQILGLKHRISSANDYKQLKIRLVDLWIEQSKLIHKLNHYIPDEHGYEDNHIKQSKPFDAYGILKIIQGENLKENEIKPYLCTLIGKETGASNLFLDACLQANKIIRNG